MDERNIKGVIVGSIMIIGFVVAIFFIMGNDKKRVNSIDTSEAEKIIKEREEEKEEEKKDEKEEKKEISTFKSFELSYKREEVPKASYYIKLDENRYLTTSVDEDCFAESICTPNKENNTLLLTDYEYKLVIDLYNKLYTDEWPKETKGSFVVTVSRLANGNKEMYNNNTNGWGMYQMYDADNDGRVLYREYGKYALEVFNY